MKNEVKCTPFHQQYQLENEQLPPELPNGCPAGSPLRPLPVSTPNAAPWLNLPGESTETLNSGSMGAQGAPVSPNQGRKADSLDAQECEVFRRRHRERVKDRHVMRGLSLFSLCSG